MKKKSIIAICGSLRLKSYNKRLMYAIGMELEQQNLIVTCIDLHEHQLPLYNHDIVTKSGPPAKLLELRDMVDAADGLLLVSPEYCGSIPGAFKNAIDWLSISLHKDDPIYTAFRKKPVAAAVATTSKVGGSKCAEHMRGIAATAGSIMMPHILVLHDAQNVDIENLEHIKAFARDVADFIDLCSNSKR